MVFSCCQNRRFQRREKKRNNLYLRLALDMVRCLVQPPEERGSGPGFWCSTWRGVLCVWWMEAGGARSGLCRWLAESYDGRQREEEDKGAEGGLAGRSSFWEAWFWRGARCVELSSWG